MKVLKHAESHSRFKTTMLMWYQIEVSDVSLVWIAVRARECSQARQDSGQAPVKNVGGASMAAIVSDGSTLLPTTHFEFGLGELINIKS